MSKSSSFGLLGTVPCLLTSAAGLEPGEDVSPTSTSVAVSTPCVGDFVTCTRHNVLTIHNLCTDKFNSSMQKTIHTTNKKATSGEALVIGAHGGLQFCHPKSQEMPDVPL